VIGRLLAVGVLVTTSAAGQSFTRAWFPDGAEVRLRTETTGGTQTVTGGGGIRDEHLFRILQDSRYDVIFQYELEAERVRGSDAVTVRIKPTTTISGIPTIATVREFPAVRIGQEVKIEILANPATGERVYDIFRPDDEPSPAPGHSMVRVSVNPGSPGVKLTVNGKPVWLENDWTPGKPARLHMPGQGAYYLSWESRRKFRLAGYVEKNRLIFLIDGQYVEMTFPDNVLTTAEGGPVWVYHDPNYVDGRAMCFLETYRSF